jgi:hypothetical protein
VRAMCECDARVACARDRVMWLRKKSSSSMTASAMVC